jgi:phosphoribosylanthranilate isomerase
VTRVKVCGITTPEDGLAAVAAGADAIGFVFWPRSSRAVDVETARRIATALPPFVLRVGVFVDATRETLKRTAEEVGLDLLQLHGAEPPDAVIGLPRRVVKALSVGAGFWIEEVDGYVERGAAILLDAGSAAQPGGTGSVFDWSVARRARERIPRLILAGGLTPGNVAEAIRTVEPFAVDVSSGVESAPGRKDETKVKAFIEAVRRAG